MGWYFFKYVVVTNIGWLTQTWSIFFFNSFNENWRFSFMWEPTLWEPCIISYGPVFDTWATMVWTTGSKILGCWFSLYWRVKVLLGLKIDIPRSGNLNQRLVSCQRVHLPLGYTFILAFFPTHWSVC
jgi:hypothetical protein